MSDVLAYEQEGYAVTLTMNEPEKRNPLSACATFSNVVIGMSRAAEMMLTGDTIDARKALEWNLVSQVVPLDQLMTAASEMAGRIAQNPSHNIRLTKRLMRESLRAPLETVLELSAVYQAVSHKTPDHTEAVNAFLEKRAPQYS